MLLWLHPEIAHRSCDRCKQFLYNEETGEERENAATGEPVPRGRGTALPCQTPQGCPMGKPDERRALTDKNIKTYTHYLECKATGVFPDDGMVTRNAGVIRAAEENAARIIQWKQQRTADQTNKLLVTVLTNRG